jgi:hypothetical protein
MHDLYVRHTLSPAEAHLTSRTSRMLADDIAQEPADELRRPRPRMAPRPVGILRAELPADWQARSPRVDGFCRRRWQSQFALLVAAFGPLPGVR